MKPEVSCLPVNLKEKDFSEQHIQEGLNSLNKKGKQKPFNQQHLKQWLNMFDYKTFWNRILFDGGRFTIVLFVTFV